MNNIYLFISSAWSRARSIKWAFLLIAFGTLFVTAILFCPTFDHPSAKELERIDKKLLAQVLASISEKDIKSIQSTIRGDEVHIHVFSACIHKHDCKINVAVDFKTESYDFSSAVFLFRAHVNPSIDIFRSVTLMRREWNLRILKSDWEVVLNSKNGEKEPLIYEGTFDEIDVAQRINNGVKIMSLLRSIRIGILRGSIAQFPQNTRKESVYGVKDKAFVMHWWDQPIST